MSMAMGLYSDFVQVIAIGSAQGLAGRLRRINFEGLAFASKAILKQNKSDHAVSQVCLPLQLNKLNFGEKTYNPFEPKRAHLKP